MSDPDDEKADSQVQPGKPPAPDGGPEFTEANEEQPPDTGRGPAADHD